MAMDPKMKSALIEDLDRFTRRKEFYWRVGKAWKRGYLLYGPPGTGKSSSPCLYRLLSLEIKGLLEKVQATPAEVAGELMKSEDPDVALRGLIKCLHNRVKAEMQQES
ncbi:hypothetical protein CRYUN_Cryun28dG0098900 [Craigia yunnanensis]